MQEFVSIVIPVYNEGDNIAAVSEGIVEEMKKHPYEYELLYVNDGSSDHTWQEISRMAEKFENVRGIDLLGNYGQTIALRVGFKEAKGGYIVALDGDQQHHPSYIPVFIDYLEKGYDFVSADKTWRAESWVQNKSAKIGHWLISRITGVKMKYFGATPKAYRSYMLKDLNLLGDAHRFIGAILARKGIKYTEFRMKIDPRVGGKSKYGMNKVFLVILDLIFLKFIISYMNKPFRLFGMWGGIIFLIGMVFTLILTIGSIFFDVYIREQYLAEFLFFIALTLIGLFLISIGIIAEIGIHNYFSEKNHKPYNIRQTTSKKS